MIVFSKANTKISKLYKRRELAPWWKGKRIYSLDLLSGHSCPYASECLSKAVQTEDGLRIEDGDKCRFRCFSASQEVLFPLVFKRRYSNWQTLRTARTENKIYNILSDSLPANCGILRFHCAGDFFSRAYFLAALRLAENNPETLFYCYTKAVRFIVDHMDEIPANFVWTASRGGVDDHLIDKHKLREARVVFSKWEARKLGLPIDQDDSHAARPDLRSDSFALLLHGTQPKGSIAAKALYKILKRKGK